MVAITPDLSGNGTGIGNTPDPHHLQIGVVTTLPTNSSATSTIRTIGDVQYLDLGLPRGATGDNAISIGMFVGAHNQIVPVGFDRVQTTAYSSISMNTTASAFVRDPAVNSSYVNAHPHSAFLDAASAGFRYDEPSVRLSALGLSGSGDEVAILQEGMALGRERKASVDIPAGTFLTSATIDGRGLGNTLAKIVGVGAARSTMQVTTNGINGLLLDGQYQRIEGFTVAYATQQYRGMTASAAIVVGGGGLGGFGFGKVALLLVQNAYYGFRAAATMAGVQQNISFDAIRASNCYASCFDFSSVGSGSIYSNLYGSNLSLPNCLNVASFGDQAGFVGLINLEHSCVAGSVLNFALANNLPILSTHMEGLSLMRSGTTLDPADICCFIRTSGQGIPEVGSIDIDTCHVGALIVKSLTRTGATARAYIDIMEWAQKYYSGSTGIEVGDNCFLEGADTGTSNEYNGSHVVTAAGVDGTGYYVEFTVSGTPASPTDIASGSDCVTISRGTFVVSAIPIVYGTGNAHRFRIRNLYTRDVRTVGATPLRRQNMLRFVRADSTVPVKLEIEEISTIGQRSGHSYWLAPATIVGYERTSNVTTLYFNRSHGLRSDTILRIYGATDTSFNGITGALTFISEYAVSFTQTGADKALTRDSVTRAILQTYAIASVQRASNYAIITFTTSHLLSAGTGYNNQIGVGLRISVQAQDATYNAVDALILDVPSSTSIKIRNVGSDAASTADNGTVMLVEGGLSLTTLADTAPLARLVLPDDWTHYMSVIGSLAIASGVTSTLATDTVLRATVNRHRVEILSVEGGDARLLYLATVSSTNAIQIKAVNPTAASITSPICKVYYRMRGD